MQELEIEKVVTISSGHITKEDNQTLGRSNVFIKGKSSVISYSNYGYGYLFHLPKEEKDLEELKEDLLNENYSEAFCNCLQLAFDNDCGFLRIDCDGPETKGLEIFEW